MSSVHLGARVTAGVKRRVQKVRGEAQIYGFFTSLISARVPY